MEQKAFSCYLLEINSLVKWTVGLTLQGIFSGFVGCIYFHQSHSLDEHTHHEFWTFDPSPQKFSE